MRKICIVSLMLAVAIFFVCGCSDTSNNHPMLKKALQSKRMGEYRNAELCYKKYLEKNPSAAEVHLELAELYDEHLEDYLLAIYHYKEYLRLTDDKDSGDAKSVKGFISRCEQRYLAKGKTVKKVYLTDEEEIERMSAAYKKKLAEEQKALALEVERLKKESEETAKKETPASAPVPAPEAAPVTAAADSAITPDKEDSAIAPDKEEKVESTEKKDTEKSENNSVKSPEKNDAPAETADRNKSDSPIAAEKKENVLPPETSAESQTAAVVAEDKKEKKTETIKDFSKLPGMQTTETETAAAKKTVEKKVIEYKVAKGDTFTHISRKFYGSIRYYKKLMKYNNISNPNSLRIGKIIKIPPLEVLKGEKND